MHHEYFLHSLAENHDPGYCTSTDGSIPPDLLQNTLLSVIITDAIGSPKSHWYLQPLIGDMIVLHITHKGQIPQASAEAATTQEVKQIKNRHVRFCLVDHLQDLLKDFTEPLSILWAPSARKDDAYPFRPPEGLIEKFNASLQRGAQR